MFSLLSKKQHALTTAWCIRKEPKLLGILSPAAFLVEIGKVLIAQQIIANNAQLEFKNALLSLKNVEAAEREVVGVDTPEVSASVFEHWRFEQDLIDTIRNCENPQNAKENNQKAVKILHVVRTAVQINGATTEESTAAAKELVTKYDLDMESFEKALQNF
jgi:HD-like signal output (HDOD) protein